MGTKQIEEIILKVSIDDSRATSNISRYDSVAKKATITNNSLSQSFGSLKGIIAALGLAKLGKEAFDIAVQYDKIHQSLKTVTGSQSAANAEFEFLNKLADDLGVTLPSIAEGYTKLFASLQGAGIARNIARELTQGVAELSTAMGLAESDTSGITRALAQMASKGKISSEELQQLAERGVDSFGIASRAIGVTTKELSKMLEQGEVISSEFLPKFGDQLRKEFGGAAKEASESAQANINRLKNEWARALDDMGGAITKFVPVLTSLLRGFNEVVEAVDETARGFNIWIGELFGIAEATDISIEKDLALARAKRKAAAEAKRNAQEVAKEKAEIEKLNKAYEALSAIGQIGRDFILAEDLEKIRDDLKLTTLEFEKLSPAILDALSKGADTKTIKETLKSTISAFKQELNKVVDPKEQKESFKGAFDGLINSALELKNALNMKDVLGLNEKEFEKIGKRALAAAASSGQSTKQLREQVNLLRRLGTFDEKKKAKDLIMPELKGTTFEAGTAAATEFLEKNKVDMERNELLTKIEKNTKNNNKTTIVAK
jgi:tape measure domain-containing protein